MTRPQTRPPLTLTVLRTEPVTPHLVRVVLGGDGFDSFAARAETDSYVKLELPHAGETVVRTYTVRRGHDVELVVRTELTDHVHLHGYDLIADVGPGRPGRIAFTADAPGRFEIELEDRGLEIGELEVRP